MIPNRARRSARRTSAAITAHGGPAYAFAVLDAPAGRQRAALIVNLGIPLQMLACQELFGLMSEIGWIDACAPLTFAVDPADPPVATLTIGESDLELSTDTEFNRGVLYADEGRLIDPPQGWWKAVEDDDNRCLVVLVDVINLRRMRKPVRRLTTATRQGAALIGSASVHAIGR